MDAIFQNLGAIIDRGGMLMIPLLACSLVAFTVIIERLLYWTLRRLFERPALRHQFIVGDDAVRRRLVQRSRDPVIRLLGARWQAAAEAPDHLLVYERERRAAGRLMALLDTMISVAPLLGILGTVVGIMISFDLVGQSRHPDPSEALGGIAQAFITTAAGLAIAILSLLAFNYFAARERAALDEMRTALLQLDGTRLAE